MMVKGTWDTSLYNSSAATRTATGKAHFAYHADTASMPMSDWKAAPDLDPLKIKDSVLGVRECRDSAEHPETVPVMVFFDVTGSMGVIPQKLQEHKLGHLMEYLIGRGGIAHPQVLTGAIGDATIDRVPFQISQFEADNRIDEQLRQLFLESGGGGQKSESYCLAFYAAARKTATDAWEKRGKKGYLVTIGDEMSWPLKAKQVESIFGDKIQERQLEVADLIREAEERWEIIHVIPREDSGHGKDPEVHQFWRELLGERVLIIDSIDNICELIAAQIALMEGADFDDVKRDVGDVVANALVPTASVGGWNAPAAQVSGTLDPPKNQPGSTTRF
jgi:hypothetical protein